MFGALLITSTPILPLAMTIPSSPGKGLQLKPTVPQVPPPPKTLHPVGATGGTVGGGEGSTRGAKKPKIAIRFTFHPSSPSVNKSWQWPDWTCR
jgi:hypothetical protein